MKITKKPYRTPWILLSLISLFLFQAAGAQDKAAKATVNSQEIEKTYQESGKEGVAITPQDHTEIIRHLLETIKELKAENEELRQENERERMKAANKLNAIEARLAEIERKTARNASSDAGPSPVLVLRSPRYDSNYTPIYIEPSERVRAPKHRNPSTRR